MENRESTEYLNYLRVFAALAVIMLHSLCTPVVFCQDSYTQTELFWVRLSRNWLNWCVPVFVMITGVLFLNPQKELPLEKLFKKYLSRFAIVILTFGTLYSLMELVFVDRTFSGFQILLAIKNALTANTWDHMWYIYMAIGLYIVIPLIKQIVNNISDKVLYYSIGALFFTSSILPYIATFVTIQNHISMVSIYIFYLLLGYAFHYKNLRLKNSYSVAILLLCALYAALIQTSDFFIQQNDAAMKTMLYDSPVMVMASLAVFSLFKNIKRENRIIKFMGPLTFGIYIIHPVFINFLYKVMHITVERFPLGISLLVVLSITVSCSIITTFMLRLIPFVRKHVL